MVVKGGTGGDQAADGGDRWVVLLEAASNGGSLGDMGAVRAILKAMRDADGVALHAPDRIAVQVQVQAADVALALGAALGSWHAAAPDSAPTGWHVVRAEVLTPEEFKKDCELG